MLPLPHSRRLPRATEIPTLKVGAAWGTHNTLGWQGQEPLSFLLTSECLLAINWASADGDYWGM